MAEKLAVRKEELQHQVWELDEQIEYKTDKGVSCYDLVIKHGEMKKELELIEKLLQA